MAALSQAYLEWEQATEQRGRKQGLQEGIQEGIQQGLQQGLQQGELTFALRLLNRKFGALPESLRLQITALSIAQLEALGEALLDFSTLADLENWLQNKPSV